MILNSAITVALRIFITFSLLLSVNTFAAITFVDSITNQGNSDNGASITVPAGTQVGDVLVAQVVLGGNATVTTQTGWSQIGNVEQTGDVQQSLYYKVATAADIGASPRSPSWGFSGILNILITYPRPYILSISVFRGVDNVTPIAGDAGENSNSGSVLSDEKINAPAVTTLNANSYLLAAYAVDEANRDFTAASGCLLYTSDAADE